MIRLLILCLLCFSPVMALAETEELNLPKPPPAQPPKPKKPAGPVHDPLIGLEQEVQVDKEKRHYHLYVPGKPASKPRPLVIVLHDDGGSPRTIAERTGFTALAERENFLLAYPEGSGYVPTWNAGRCCGYAARKNVDDVSFIKALITDVMKKQPVDKNRIYASGFSNGGMMAYRLACEMSSTITAFGIVAGAMNTAQCSPQGRPSIIIFHALNDSSVNYGGGVPKGGSRAALAGKPVADASVRNAMEFWTKASMCRNFPSNQEQEDTTIINYFCAQNRDIRLYTVNTGGHSWPGEKHDPKMVADQIDPAELPSSIPATELIWEFFRQHPPSEVF